MLITVSRTELTSCLENNTYILDAKPHTLVFFMPRPRPCRKSALDGFGCEIVQALRKSAAGVELFKEEFRATQRLRSTEGIFIPEVGG